MKALLFGAGASCSFFEPKLTTDYLTSQMLYTPLWNEVVAKYNSLLEEGRIPINVNEIISYIYDIHAKFPQYNFEQICEIIDKTASISFDNVPMNNMFNSILHLFATVNIKRYGYQWSNVPFLYRTVIAESIMRLNKSNQYKDLIDAQNKFIRSFESEHVSIISTNYDDVLFDSLSDLDFETGFEEGQYLNIRKLQASHKTIIFPHGHLRFVFDDHTNIRYFLNSEKANEERWQKLNSPCIGQTMTLTGGMFAYNFNTFITTGQTKDDNFNQMPYAFYYQKMAFDIFNCDRIYVIGYSFGDNHINRLLKSFTELNAAHKIIIVDYITGEISRSDLTGPRNKILPILDKLSIGGISINCELEKINTKGYGALTNQIVLYKEGYAKFLQDYNNGVIID